MRGGDKGATSGGALLGLVMKCRRTSQGKSSYGLVFSDGGKRPGCTSGAAQRWGVLEAHCWKLRAAHAPRALSTTNPVA